MKRPAFKIALCFSFFCFFVFSAKAQQQFKWVHGGGTNEDLSSVPLATEGTQYMCTDADGNVYALSQVGDNPVYADTFVRLAGAYGSDFNVLITSYNCNGQMRWAKLIGSPNECIGYGIAADNLGHIYVAGFFTNETLHVGYDTAIAGLADEDEGLIQFDTNGHFNWIRYVGDNTTASLDGSYAAGSVLAIDASNNAHFFNYMKHGVHITPTETSIGGTYDLVYDHSGTLLSSARIDLDSEWYLNSVVIDPVTNKLYASGEINQSIYGGILTDTFFAAAFDSSRNLLWQYFCGIGDDDALVGVALDKSKHLYFSGDEQPVAGGIGFCFNGDTVSAPGFWDISLIMKTDTNGHPQWIRHYDSHSSINAFYGITSLPNNMVAAVGTFVESVTNGTDSLTTRPGYYWSPYIVIVDSEGNLLTMQQAYGDGFQNEGKVIMSDKVGNIYIGGEVADSIFGGAISAYHSVGGNTDFFVMKYGVDCSCTSGPTAAYTDTGTHHTIGVTYTGTTTGLDSVVWSYGDGTTSTGTTGTHAYSAVGTYEVCVTTYTDCGVDEHCSNFVVDSATHVSIAPSGSPRGGVTVFPNPAREELTIEAPSGSPQGGAVLINNMMGQEVYSGVMSGNKLVVNISGLASGVYILELVGVGGERDVVRVVKE